MDVNCPLFRERLKTTHSYPGDAFDRISFDVCEVLVLDAGCHCRAGDGHDVMLLVFGSVIFGLHTDFRK